MFGAKSGGSAWMNNFQEHILVNEWLIIAWSISTLGYWVRKKNSVTSMS